MNTKKILWAIVDQIAIAIAFFYVTFILARELTQEAYGAFAMAYAIVTLGQLLYQGFFYEPISIFGVGEYKANFRRYAVRILQAHLVIALLLSACFGAASILFENSSIKYALIGVSISSPFILFYHLMRRFLYAAFLVSLPAIISVLYSVGVIGLIYYLIKIQSLSLLAAFVVLGGSSLVVGLVGLIVLFTIGGANVQRDSKLTGILEAHLSYGKFAAGSYSVNWITGNFYFVALPVILGLDATGTLKALLNFIAPVQQVLGALSLIYLPYFASLIAQEKPKLLMKSLYYYLLITIILLVGNLLFFYSLGESILMLVYGGKYSELAGYVTWIGVLSLIGGIATPFLCVLRAMNHPKKILNANLCAACVVPIALLLAYVYDINGAILGLILSSSISTGLVYYYYLKTKDVIKDRPVEPKPVTLV